MSSSFEPVTAQACVRGFVSAVGHQFGRQGGARVSRSGAVTILEHSNDIEHPWPRAFRFKLELLVEVGATAAEINNVYRQAASGSQVECVINLLVTEPAGLIEKLASIGFTHAFDKALMVKPVCGPQQPQVTPEGVHVRKVDTPALVAQTVLLGQDHGSVRGTGA